MSGLPPVVNEVGLDAQTSHSHNSRTLENLNLLRLIATYRVVFFHATCILEEESPYVEPFRFALDLFPIRLDTFFVLSGFVVSVSVARRESTPLAYLQRRLWRLLPLLFATTLFAVVLHQLRGTTHSFIFSDEGERLTWQRVVCSALVLPCGREPLVYPAWTLTFEWLLYSCVALGLAVKSTHGWRAVVTVSTLLALATCGLLGVPRNEALSDVLSHPHLLETGCGVALGASFVRFESAVRAFALERRGLVLLFSLASLVLGLVQPLEAGPALLNYGLSVPPAVAVTSSAVLLECAGFRVTSPRLRTLVVPTYSIYPTHAFVIDFLMVVWLTLGVPDAILAPTYWVCATIGAILAGHSVHRWLDEPVARWSDTFRSAKRRRLLS